MGSVHFPGQSLSLMGTKRRERKEREIEKERESERDCTRTLLPEIHISLLISPSSFRGQTLSDRAPPSITLSSAMRIRKRPQNHLAPAYSSFLPSSRLIGASATPEALLERGAREREEEHLSATGHVLERETGGPRGRLLLFSNGDDLLPPPATECISGEFSDLTLRPPPPESAIDGRDLSSHISDFSEVQGPLFRGPYAIDLPRIPFYYPALTPTPRGSARSSFSL